MPGVARTKTFYAELEAKAPDAVTIHSGLDDGIQYIEDDGAPWLCATANSHAIYHINFEEFVVDPDFPAVVVDELSMRAKRGFPTFEAAVTYAFLL